MRDATAQPDGVGEAEDHGAEGDRYRSAFFAAAERYAKGEPADLVAMLTATPETAAKFQAKAFKRPGPHQKLDDTQEQQLVLEVIREITFPASGHALWKGFQKASRQGSIRDTAEQVVAERFSKLLDGGKPVEDTTRALNRIVTKWVAKGNLSLPTEPLGFSMIDERNGKRRLHNNPPTGKR